MCARHRSRQHKFSLGLRESAQMAVEDVGRPGVDRVTGRGSAFVTSARRTVTVIASTRTTSRGLSRERRARLRSGERLADPGTEAQLVTLGVSPPSEICADQRRSTRICGIGVSFFHRLASPQLQTRTEPTRSKGPDRKRYWTGVAITNKRPQDGSPSAWMQVWKTTLSPPA